MSIPLEDSQVRALADAAAAAPSLYNAQPWHFRCARGTGTFRVYADSSRAIPEADPDGRGLCIGCGAAVMNLRVAAAQDGLATVTQLLPDPDDHRLLATVRIDEAAQVEHGLSPLREGIEQRHTGRYPFAAKRMPRDVRAHLAEAAACESVTLTFPEDWHLRWVLELAAEADARRRGDQRRDEEFRQGTPAGASAAGAAVVGVPQSAGPRKGDVSAPVRDFAAGRRTADMGTAPFEKEPQIALLATRGDSPVDWLRTGQGMQRVLLLATLKGLVNSFETGVLDWAGTHWPLRDPVSPAGTVQMMLRLGYGPQGPVTPRRPLSETLDIEP